MTNSQFICGSLFTVRCHSMRIANKKDSKVKLIQQTACLVNLLTKSNSKVPLLFYSKVLSSKDIHKEGME